MYDPTDHRATPECCTKGHRSPLAVSKRTLHADMLLLCARIGYSPPLRS
jgi:hypothetical protein